MATVLKKISELEHLEELTSSSNVIIEENGEAKRFSAASLGKVKTVNGVEPDENGNIEVEAGSGGGVSSWNDLTDKPFSEETIALDIQWDGEISDRVYVEQGSWYYVHVDDSVLPAEAFIGMSLSYIENGESLSITLDSSKMFYQNDVLIIYQNAVVIPYDNYVMNELVLPKAGIYFTKRTDADFYTTSLKGESTVIKKLDNKYTDNPVTLTLSYTYNEETGEYTDVSSDLGFYDVLDAYENGQPVFIRTNTNFGERYPASVIISDYYEGVGVIAFGIAFKDALNNTDMALNMLNPLDGGDMDLFPLPSSVGSGLPEVTTENNGQILGVTDGTWGAMDAPSGLPEITTENEGAFLRIVNGVPAWVLMENAEDGVY